MKKKRNFEGRPGENRLYSQRQEQQREKFSFLCGYTWGKAEAFFELLPVLCFGLLLVVVVMIPK